MKIGIVCYPTYGGSGIVATELGMEMAEKGHQVHFISYSVPARLDVTLPNIQFHQVSVQPYDLFQYQPYSLALSTLMVDIALKHGLDLIHVHYAIPHAYAAYFAKQILKEKNINLPVVTTLHGTDITLVGKHPVYKSAVEFSINQSDIVTTVSESLKQDTMSVFNITKEIKVVPNFIDFSVYNKDEPCIRRNFAEADERLLVHVSNLRKVKRIQDVIEVFYRVQKHIPSKLVIVGEGPEWEKAEVLITQYGLQDKVKNVGKVKNLFSILRISDLFLLPSEQESFGLAALEAMAAGVPVVSSNAGGIPEVNIDGKSGYTCDIGDVDGMAEKALTILKEDEVLDQFKIQAYAQAQQFDRDKVLPMYERIYNLALEQLTMT